MENIKPGTVDNFNISMNRHVKAEVDAIATNFGYSRSQLIEFAVLDFISDKTKMEDSIKKDAVKKLKVLKRMEVHSKEEIKGTKPVLERKRNGN
jgi:metal-responsive CopG/Arc/MetJ family transcriptional regulator